MSRLTPFPPRPLSLVLFDLDGTLADTACDLIGTLNVLLMREGLPVVAPEAARSLVGAGARALIEGGFAMRQTPLPAMRIEPLVMDFLTHYEAHIADETRLFPGALAALDRFRDAGFRLAVCTNKPEGLALSLLEALDMRRFFGPVLGADTLTVRKPDPEHLRETVRRAGGDPACAVMIGDSEVDAETAKAAGVPLVIFGFGYTQFDPETFGADALLHDYRELKPALARIMARTA